MLFERPIIAKLEIYNKPKGWNGANEFIIVSCFCFAEWYGVHEFCYFVRRKRDTASQVVAVHNSCFRYICKVQKRKKGIGYYVLLGVDKTAVPENNEQQRRAF